MSRVLFSGYAHVHFECFLPVYQELRKDDRLEIVLSGGFRSGKGDDVRFSIDGFYDPFPVDPAAVISPEQARSQDFDVVVCAHTSDALFPRSARRSVQIFHGVSFKNLGVRAKALRYDFLCLPGRYHAERFRKYDLLGWGSSALVTGFPKVDSLANPPGDADGVGRLGLDPGRPTLLLAPTGDKGNALEAMGREVIEAVRDRGEWNLLVKPHDHPERQIDWYSELADLEGDGVALVRDTNVTPYLAMADLLITDASSVALEYTLLDRPMVFLDIPKLLERIRSRAPAMDLDTYGRKLGSLAGDPDELVRAVGEGLAEPGARGSLRRQAAAHVFHDAGRAADHVAGVIRHAAGLGPVPDGVIDVSAV